MSDVVALGGDRLADLHSYLDEAIAAGATSAVLIVSYPAGAGRHGGDWEAWATGDISVAERAFIYSQLHLLAISSQTHPDEDEDSDAP